MSTTHGHTPLEAARETGLLLLAGMGILIWAPILAIWTAFLALRHRGDRPTAQA
jgi:hypothetical protein